MNFDPKSKNEHIDGATGNWEKPIGFVKMLNEISNEIEYKQTPMTKLI